MALKPTEPFQEFTFNDQKGQLLKASQIVLAVQAVPVNHAIISQF